MLGLKLWSITYCNIWRKGRCKYCFPWNKVKGAESVSNCNWLMAKLVSNQKIELKLQLCYGVTQNFNKKYDDWLMSQQIGQETNFTPLNTDTLLYCTFHQALHIILTWYINPKGREHIQHSIRHKDDQNPHFILWHNSTIKKEQNGEINWIEYVKDEYKTRDGTHFLLVSECINYGTSVQALDGQPVKTFKKKNPKRKSFRYLIENP